MSETIVKAQNSNPSKRKAILISSITGSVAICLGIAAGIVGAKFFGNKQTIDYSNVNVNALTDDIDAARSKYNKAKSSGTPLEQALKPSEMVNLAIANYSALPSTKAVGLGSALSMGVTQQIQSIQIKNDGKYFEESNSIGLVNLFDRMYQDGDSTSCYWGDNSDYSSHAKRVYSNEEYANMMGRKVSDPMIYVISRKTAITKEESVKSGRGISKIVKENGGYTVDLELNRKTSVVNYVKQMQNISGLTGYPTFAYCHLTFHLSEDLMPIEYTSYEKYNATKASVPLPVDIEGTLTTKFYTTGTYAIPSLSDVTSGEYSK